MNRFGRGIQGDAIDWAVKAMLSLTAKYALRAIYYLTSLEDGQYKLAQDIAQHTGIPRAYLARILSTMAKQGILHSRTGVGGGFCIKEESLGLTLYDIAGLFDNLNSYHGCVWGFETVCEFDFCPMHDCWAELDSRAMEILKSTTLRWLKSSKTSFHWNRIENSRLKTKINHWRQQSLKAAKEAK